MIGRFLLARALTAAILLLGVASVDPSARTGARRAAPHPGTGRRYRIIDLGAAPVDAVGDRDAAMGLNDRGDVIGTFVPAGGHDARAFLWRRGRLRDLGTAFGYQTSYGFGINDRGWVAGIGDHKGRPRLFLLTRYEPRMPAI